MTQSEATAESYLVHETSVGSWLKTLDHKRLGLMYLGAALGAFAIGGVLALLARGELTLPGHDILDAETYRRVFKAHGVIMVFLVLLPAIPAGLGNFFLPLVLGGRTVAFPRLNLAAFYLYILGALITLFAAGGTDAGWSFEMAYSAEAATSSVLWLVVGVTFVAMSAVLTSINFIVTIHTLRAPGVGWSRVPVFAWSLYASALVQLFATPVLGLSLILLAAERTLGTGIFDPALGGDPVLFQHFFWFYSHPALMGMVLPALGVAAEVIATHSQRSVYGGSHLVGSLFALAFLSFFGWGSHMYTSGMSEYASLVFSAMTLFAVVPSVVAVFHLLATLHGGAIEVRAALLYALGFLALFALGTAASVFLALPSLATHLQGTSFVTAQLHFLVGSVLFALLAGLHYWWPKITGRLIPERPAVLGFVLVFLGTLLGFLGQFAAGAEGLPRRHADFLAYYAGFELVSGIATFVGAIGVGVVAYTMVRSLFSPRTDAAKNPWDSQAYEWLADSPPAPEGFDRTPLLERGPYDYV